MASAIIAHNDAILFKMKRLMYAHQPSWKYWAVHRYRTNETWFAGASRPIEYARRVYREGAAMRRIHRVVGWM